MITNSLISKKIASMIEKYKSNGNEDFFFTEKELHSFFYSLCLTDHAFTSNGMSYVHAEYPTPFKCSLNDSRLKIRPPESKYKRGHIDLVIINPHFVDWIRKNNIPNEFITGTPPSDIFPKHYKKAAAHFSDFHADTKESVLLNALEFKYLRHKYSGQKHPIKGVLQDASKMAALTQFGKESLGSPTAFVKETECLVFIGHRMSHIKEKLQSAINSYAASRVTII